MAKSQGSASSTPKISTSAPVADTATIPFDKRITDAISALNAHDKQLALDVDEATAAVQSAGNAFAAAKHQLGQAQGALDTNKAIIDHRRGQIAKLFGLDSEEAQNSRAVVQLLEPFALLPPKESSASDDNERALKRRRTTNGSYASASKPAALNMDSGDLAIERAKAPAQRRSLVPTSPATPMVSMGKRPPTTVKFMEVYHQYSTTYIPIDQEKTRWIELRCHLCGGNSSSSFKTPLKGARGFQMHLIQEHGMKGLKQHEVPTLCKYRDIEQSELDELAETGADVSAQGNFWVKIVLCGGNSGARRDAERTSGATVQSVEQDDAPIVAAEKKPVNTESAAQEEVQDAPIGATNKKPANIKGVAQEEMQDAPEAPGAMEEDGMSVVEEDLGETYAPLRPQAATGKLKAIGRRSL